MAQKLPLLPMALAAGGVVGAIALWTRSRSGSATGASGTSAWTGAPERRDAVRQPHFPSGAAGRQAFVAYAVGLLQRHGLSLQSAQLFAAHLARESGWGQSIWNNNFGNIKAGSNPQHPYFVLTDRLGFTDPYRAYDTDDAGIEDDIGLVRNHSRYQDAWQMLLDGDPNWYGQLGLDGYYEGPPDPNNPGVHTNHNSQTIIPVQHEYDSIFATVQSDYALAGGASVASMGGGSMTGAIVVAGVAGLGAWYFLGRG